MWKEILKTDKYRCLLPLAGLGNLIESLAKTKRACVYVVEKDFACLL